MPEAPKLSRLQHFTERLQSLVVTNPSGKPQQTIKTRRFTEARKTPQFHTTHKKQQINDVYNAARKTPRFKAAFDAQQVHVAQKTSYVEARQTQENIVVMTQDTTVNTTRKAVLSDHERDTVHGAVGDIGKSIGEELQSSVREGVDSVREAVRLIKTISNGVSQHHKGKNVDICVGLQISKQELQTKQ